MKNEDEEVLRGVASFEEIEAMVGNKRKTGLKMKRNEASLAKKETTLDDPNIQNNEIQIQEEAQVEEEKRMIA